MVTQTRDVLTEYDSREGTYDEVVIDGQGHSPHTHQLEEVLESMLAFPNLSKCAMSPLT